MRFFLSTRENRKAQRINAICQIAGNTLAKASPDAKLPAKMAQTATSIITACLDTTKPVERVINVLEALVSSSEMALLIASVYQDEPDDHTIKTLFVCELLYQGILLASWGISEVLREPYEPEQIEPQGVENIL